MRGDFRFVFTPYSDGKTVIGVNEDNIVWLRPNQEPAVTHWSQAPHRYTAIRSVNFLPNGNIEIQVEDETSGRAERKTIEVKPVR